MSLMKPTPEEEGKMLKDRARALMAWRTATYVYPQQRLGQILSNALDGTAWASDPFYLPDAELAQYLEAYAAGEQAPKT